MGLDYRILNSDLYSINGFAVNSTLGQKYRDISYSMLKR